MHPLRPGEPHPVVTAAGLSILRQRTAKGTLFIMLEDETGPIRCVVRPHVLEYLDDILRADVLIVRGGRHLAGNWRGLVVTGAWRVNDIFGGHEGRPFEAGGRDRWIRSVEEKQE